MNSLPFRVESSGFSCGQSIEFYSSATYFTLAASFPSRVGAGEFSEKKTDEWTSKTFSVTIHNFKTDY